MKPAILSSSLVLGLWISLPQLQAVSDQAPSPNRFRPPAVPLVTCDPYFSIWSFADRLTDDDTRHWTGKKQGLESIVRVDGKPYRLMGADPRQVRAFPQTGLEVLPTRTIYAFESDGLHITLTFMTPMLPEDLETLSRPVTYLTWEVHAVDGKEHAVSLYFDASAELVVNTPDQAVVWSKEHFGNLNALRMGTKEQPILAKSGDDVRIDWGYLYATTPQKSGVQEIIAGHRIARDAFIANGSLPATDDRRMPRPASDAMPVMAFAFDLGKVGRNVQSRFIILAYDDLYSAEFLHHRLRPYWRRNGAEASNLVRSATREYEALKTRCERFDEELMKDLRSVAGDKYARVAALSYRQALAGNKLVAGTTGEPFFFPKENFSDASIGTPDVIHPESPILLLLNPMLLRASLVPVFEYAKSGRWRFPFGPAQLGTYPLANGQTYGGGETSEKDQQPVEESGNLVLMTAAVAKLEGNPELAVKYWPIVTKWAQYLKENGLDPKKQLCTDDFGGPMAHNANVSLKAIEGLAAYSMLCEMRGEKEQAASYRKTAEEFASRWLKMADDGDHYRWAFDRPGSWGQKYNLIWDRLLGLHLFPPEVARKEVAFYKTKLKRFGFPLDSGHEYTKLDWEYWCAALAESPADAQTLMAPLYDFVNQSPDRVPLTDWYRSTDGRQILYRNKRDKEIGFQARSVVGGVFIMMLNDSEMWKKWSDRAKVGRF